MGCSAHVACASVPTDPAPGPAVPYGAGQLNNKRYTTGAAHIRKEHLRGLQSQVTSVTIPVHNNRRHKCPLKSPAAALSRPKAPGAALPRASTCGSCTTSLLAATPRPASPPPAATAAGADAESAAGASPRRRARSAAAAPRLVPPLGAAGLPARPFARCCQSRCCQCWLEGQ